MFALAMIFYFLKKRKFITSSNNAFDFIKHGLVYRREDFFRVQELIIDESFPFLYLDECGQYFNSRTWKKNTEMVDFFQLSRIFGVLIPATVPDKLQVDVNVRDRTSFVHVRMLRMGGGLAIVRPIGVLTVPFLPKKLVNDFRKNELIEKTLIIRSKMSDMRR